MSPRGAWDGREEQDKRIVDFDVVVPKDMSDETVRRIITNLVRPGILDLGWASGTVNVRRARK